MIYYNYKQLSYIISQCLKPLKLKVDIKELNELIITDLKSENEEA